MFEVIESVLCLISFFVLLYFLFRLKKSLDESTKTDEKQEKREEIRLEAEKNALCDISKYLFIIADYYVKKDIR